MSLFKKEANPVGRPSNEMIKKRRNKKIAIAVASIAGVALVGGGAYLLLSGTSLSDLMGNSVTKVGRITCNTKKLKATYGDVDKDGKITVNDSVFLSRYLAGWSGYKLDCQAQLNADVNVDGKLDETDSVIIARYYSGWYSSLPVKDESKCDFTKIKATYGDVNKDGKVNTSDVTILERYLAGGSGYELDCQAKANADVNSDGKVNSLDSNIILKYVSGSIKTLPATKIISGDVNQDGKINTTDSKYITQYASGSRKLDSSQLLAADVNLDGKVNSLDSNIILKYVSGSIKTLPMIES